MNIQGDNVEQKGKYQFEKRIKEVVFEENLFVFLQFTKIWNVLFFFEEKIFSVFGK